ncbi:MAG: cytochrome c biogenesis protein ResB [Nocardioidaceae bacterium]
MSPSDRLEQFAPPDHLALAGSDPEQGEATNALTEAGADSAEAAAPQGGSGSTASDSGGSSPHAPALAPIEFLRWTWRQLTSMRTALVLLFLLAVASVPGSLVPQQRVDPPAVFAFKERHPSLTPVFEWLGMFDVYSSVWFSAIYALLMLSLVGCIIPRLRVYLRALRARPPRAPSNLSRLSAYDSWMSDEQVSAKVDEASETVAWAASKGGGL